MACYRPLHAYVSKKINKNGKRDTVFQVQKALFTKFSWGEGPVRRSMPCGQCIGCRLERSRQWAMRLSHEKKQHEQSCFITLTYDTQHLPFDSKLKVQDFQNFMKRLRKNTKHKIRFYHCGEYGEQTKRPHYHAILFGINFTDGKVVEETKYGLLYDSPLLKKIWKKGNVTVGEATFESMGYCARYVTKKITGKPKEKHYEHINEETGEITQRPVEYSTMSRRPGIGARWFHENPRDSYPKDFVTLRGQKMRPPKFYDRLLEKTHKKLFDKVKKKRLIQMYKNKSHIDNTDSRLSVREKCQILKAEQLKRNLE